MYVLFTGIDLLLFENITWYLQQLMNKSRHKQICIYARTYIFILYHSMISIHTLLVAQFYNQMEYVYWTFYPTK